MKTLKPTVFAILAQSAHQCEQLVADIDLIRPQTYEAGISVKKAVNMIKSVVEVYEMRFEALFKAYSEAVSTGFSHYQIEECVMQWWGACDDLHCAVEALEGSVLDSDGCDNIFLGVRSMSIVRATRFGILLKAAQTAEESKSSAVKKTKKNEEKKKDKVNSKRAKAAYGLFTSER